jgi:hypothetical protein
MNVYMNAHQLLNCPNYYADTSLGMIKLDKEDVRSFLEEVPPLTQYLVQEIGDSCKSVCLTVDLVEVLKKKIEDFANNLDIEQPLVILAGSEND